MRTWKTIKLISGRESNGECPLPSARGRYLLWLEAPLLSGGPHWVHFSWADESFCIRDFTKGMERRQDQCISATQVWQSAKSRIPCMGELCKPVQDFEFWKQKLDRMNQEGLQSHE